MKRSAITSIAVIAILLGVAIFFLAEKDQPSDVDPILNSTSSPSNSTSEIPFLTAIEEDLEIPWDIAFLPASTARSEEKAIGDMLVTERSGTLLKIAKDGGRKEISIDGVKKGGEGGLLGLTLHPNFETNNWLYIYYGVANGSETRNRVERYRFSDDQLVDKVVIIDNIPGALYHDGGRMEFGPTSACGEQAPAGKPDCYLYITTGDATRENIAQDKSSLGGKILRIKDDGSIPSDNPFGTAVWSYGHRNPQGLAWDSSGRLWETEHGRSGAATGMDELNLIVKGGNYGWPEIEGDEARSGMISPVLHSGATDTWAPASLIYHEGKLFFGGLRGAALYEVVLDGEKVKELKAHFKGEFGRIRTVRVGPDDMLYITTSNRDGRWEAKDGSDKVIRVNPEKLR